MRRITVTLAGAAMGVGALAAIPANASTTEYFTNWSGYEKVTDAPIAQAEATFTVPTVSCKNSRGTAPYYGSMWVGIGGDYGVTNPFRLTGDNGWLEQDGVSIACKSLSSAPKYQPFWEVVTGDKTFQSYVNRTYFPHGNGEKIYNNGTGWVLPQDVITAYVYTPYGSPHRGQWDFQIDVVRKGVLVKQWSQYLTMPKGSYTGDPGVRNVLGRETVEAITECPNNCTDSSGLVYMGNVTYNWADYSVSGTETGYSIASGTPIELTHRGTIVMIPGKPFSDDSDIPNDSFTTYYTKYWWR